jgi:hypothetical protein
VCHTLKNTNKKNGDDPLHGWTFFLVVFRVREVKKPCRVFVRSALPIFTKFDLAVELFGTAKLRLF